MHKAGMLLYLHISAVRHSLPNVLVACIGWLSTSQSIGLSLIHSVLFQVGHRVNIYLPVLRCPPWSTSLLSITEHLTAFAWSPSSSPLIQAECRELLRALSRIAKDLTPMIRDEAMKDFLVLLSRLGQQVPINKGIWVELCGLGKRKAVVRHQGNLKMIDIDNVAKLSMTG